MASKMKEFGMLSKRRAKESTTATAEPSPSSTAKPRQRGGVRDSSKKKKTKSGRKRAPETRSMARLVMSLSCRGYEEQLAWLEAYLRDEARDRTMDGELLLADSTKRGVCHSILLSSLPTNMQTSGRRCALCLWVRLCRECFKSSSSKTSSPPSTYSPPATL